MLCQDHTHLLDLALLQPLHVDMDAIYVNHVVSGQLDGEDGWREHPSGNGPSFSIPVVVNSIVCESSIVV